jgi:hypothetical protein
VSGKGGGGGREREREREREGEHLRSKFTTASCTLNKLEKGKIEERGEGPGKREGRKA